MYGVYTIVGKRIVLRAVKVNDSYDIRCVEADRYGRTCDAFVIQDVTTDHRTAMRIIRLIVKYKAFSCSICEITEDLLC